MRVTGPQASSTSSVRKKKGTSSSGETFSVDTPAEAQTAKASGGVAPASPLDALLAMQGVENEDQAESRGKKRGQKLLDLLEDVRRGLLTGVIPASKLNGLIAAVRSEQANVTDPKLKSILDEIDLRASVELEKLGIDSGL